MTTSIEFVEGGLVYVREPNEPPLYVLSHRDYSDIVESESVHKLGRFSPTWQRYERAALTAQTTPLANTHSRVELGLLKLWHNRTLALIRHVV